MNKGVQEQSARNEVIVRLAKKGMSANDIAAQFAISPARVHAIVKRDAQLERRRVKLEEEVRWASHN
jgi:DNA-binding CsgD family transcriptional regulator